MVEKEEDIVKRLREWPNAVMMREAPTFLMAEAADEIERLREALRFYADYDSYRCGSISGQRLASESELDYGEKARTALGRISP